MTSFVQLSEHDIAFDLVNVIDRLTGKSTSEQQISAAQREREILQHQAERQARIEAGEDVGEEDESMSSVEEKRGLAALVVNGSITQLLEQGVIDQLDIINTVANDNDLETVFILTFGLLHRINIQDVNRIIRALLPYLTNNNNNNTTSAASSITRLRILTQLFNLLNATLPTSQVLPGLPTPNIPNALHNVSTDLVATVLQALLRYGLITDQGREIAHSVPILISVVQTWELKPIILSEIYLAVYEITKQTQTHNNLNEEYLYKYLRCFDNFKTDTSAAAIAAFKAARPYAVIAAYRAITSPLSISSAPIISSALAASSPLTPHRLLSLAAISQLSNSPNIDESHIYNLLRIFATDDVDAYLSFYKNNSAWLSSHHYDHEMSLKKLRILSLCNLASQGYDRLSYQQIGEQLTLSNEIDIENSIIDAIISGRLEAKIDGEKQYIVIKRVVGSILKPMIPQKPSTNNNSNDGPLVMVADWNSLERRLNGWKGNVQTVLNKLNREEGQEEFGTEDI